MPMRGDSRQYPTCDLGMCLPVQTPSTARPKGLLQKRRMRQQQELLAQQPPSPLLELPQPLLHEILARLPHNGAAALTAVSRGMRAAAHAMCGLELSVSLAFPCSHCWGHGIRRFGELEPVPRSSGLLRACAWVSQFACSQSPESSKLPPRSSSIPSVTLVEIPAAAHSICGWVLVFCVVQ